MTLWDRIRGRKSAAKPARIKPPAPPRTPPRPYDEGTGGLRIKTPEQYLRDGGDRDRARREAEDYDRTVDGLRRDREALARDNHRLRRDREAAWSGVPVPGMYYDSDLGDYMYHGDNVVDVTEGHHHHHHHHEEPAVVVIEEPRYGYDQDDDHASHVREDHDRDQSAAETYSEPVVNSSSYEPPLPETSSDTSSSWALPDDSSSSSSDTSSSDW